MYEYSVKKMPKIAEIGIQYGYNAEFIKNSYQCWQI